MKHSIHIALLCLFLPVVSQAQIGNKGVPGIENFSYEAYQAGTQNWSIVQDRSGNMLFGNNYGILEFDGRTWHLVTQPHNKTVVRSLHEGKDGVLYVGAQNEFGFVKANNAGQKRYISLLSMIPEDKRQFSDVWSIQETSEGVYFHTADQAYLYASEKVKVIETPSVSAFSVVGDSVLVQDLNRHVYVVRPDGMRKVIDGEMINAYVLKVYDDYQGRLIFITADQGIIALSGNEMESRKSVENTFLKANRLHCALRLRNDYYALGSVNAGMLILDNEFKPIQWLNKSNGLQSNTILALQTDHIGNLWVATETGVDYVHIASPLYNMADNYNMEGTVYAMLVHDLQLYVGTNSGIFRSPWLANENPIQPTLGFRQITELAGPVWQLYQIGGQIYICFNEGLYRLDGDKAVRISPKVGFWNLQPIRKKKGLYLAGAYDGIHLFQLENGFLVYQHKLDDFEETSRVIEMDDKGNLWMAHGYKGIYRLSYNKELTKITEAKLYTHEHGFPTFWFNNLFKINNQILFGTERGTFHYDHQMDSMIPESRFNNALGNQEHIRLLMEDRDRVWFIKGPDMVDQVGVLDFYTADDFQINLAPLQPLKGRFNAGFEVIYFVDDQTVLFGTKKGIVHYDRSNNQSYSLPFETKITDVKNLVTDSVLYGQLTIDDRSTISDQMDKVKIPYDHNSVVISYGCDFYEGWENTLYSHYLEGFDKNWYDWESTQSKTYTNLPQGKYVFHAKARNIYGFESKVAQYAFEVLPPWYWTAMAKIIYSVLLIVLGLWLIKWYRKRIEKAQIVEREVQQEVLRKNKAAYQQEKLLTEKELMTLRNEKLEAEIEISKSKMEVLNAEMAASVMMITQKNGVLIKVSEEMSQLLKKAKDSNKDIIQNVIKLINKDIDTDQDWQQFKIHFDKVHGNFLERLKSEFPDLTPKDMQLAAYLRLNLSSKEISSLMNITVRSVEGCRYRLRKHLHLEGNTNLSEFVLKY